MSSLSARFGIIFVCLVLLNLSGAVVVWWSLTALQSDGTVINLAGAQRMLTQRIAKQTLLLAGGKGDAGQLRASAGRFDRVIKGLIDGDAELGLPPSESPEAATALREVQRDWGPFQKAAASVADTAGKDAASVEFVVSNDMKLLEKMNRIVSILEARSQEKVKRTILIAMSIVAVFGILVAFAWTTIIRPLCRHLLEAVRELDAAASQLNGAASQVSASSQVVAQYASEQSAAIAQTTASTDQVRQRATTNEEKAREAATFMDRAKDNFDAASRNLDDTVSSMNQIDEQTGRVSKVIRIIEEIAFQTNILALNAAVEAARAGTAGMGFAVVADEVRALAMRCQTAATETTSLIEGSVESTARGKASVKRITGSLHSAISDTSALQNLFSAVTDNSQQQAHGLMEIGRSITLLEDGTHRSAASSEETAAAAEELHAQSEMLKEVVAGLQTLVLGNSRRHDQSGSNRCEI